MPDELPVQEDGAPNEQQAEVDWQKRYTDTHAEYNRLNEQFRKFESDPEALVEFVEKHHPNLIAAADTNDDEDEQEEFQDEESDDSAQLAREVEELRKWRDKQEQRQQEATFRQEWAGWETHIKQQAKELGIDLAARDIKALKVDSAGPEDNGWVFPVAPQKANEVLKAYVDEYFKEPDEPVKRPRAPHVPAGGKAQTGVPDWSKMTQAEIDRYMAERAMALSQQQ